MPRKKATTSPEGALTEAGAAAVRRSWGAEALVALVPEGLRAAVKRVQVEGKWVDLEDPEGVEPAAWLEVMPGQNPLRPVVRNVENGRLQPGSGRYPAANNPAVVGAVAAFKYSKSYREALEAAVPFQDPDARFSLERLIEDAFDAAEGSPATGKCSHCGKTSVVTHKKDPNAIFKLIELLVGKAPQTIEVKGDISVRLQEVMQARVEAPVLYMTTEEWTRRQEALIADGTINPEWIEGSFKEVPVDVKKLAE